MTAEPDAIRAPAAGTPAAAPEYRPQPTCWVCDGAEWTMLPHAERFDMTWQEHPTLQPFHGETFRLQRCGACGFVQPDRLPAPEDYFDALYSKNRGDDWRRELDAATFRDGVYRDVLARLERKTGGRRGKLLDVGCGVGTFLKRARDAGWEVEGAEMNPHDRAFAARSVGVAVHGGTLAELAAEGRRYDAVTLNDVLEHIPRPRGVIEEALGVLEPGGWLAVKSPHGAAQLLKERAKALAKPGAEPEIASNLTHVNHFGARSLRLLLERCGYDRVEVGVGAPEIAGRAPLRRAASRVVRRAVFRTARTLPGGVRTPLAMNLQAFARKPV
ncbi:class I SAM-dependent methyltransferase [Alienimonas sp. DA493]|uniref:class I SAM-dependent methyltransferase n=1 Tax=Alienimonas sp. DA493 TaxID=3373605 RepID=UPI0037551478